MHALVRIVFSKLFTLDSEEEEAKLQSTPDDEANEGELRMSVTTKEETSIDERFAPVTTEKQVDSEEALEENVPSQTPTSFAARPECKRILTHTHMVLIRWLFRWSPFNSGVIARPRQCFGS